MDEFLNKNFYAKDIKNIFTWRLLQSMFLIKY